MWFYLEYSYFYRRIVNISLRKFWKCNVLWFYLFGQGVPKETKGTINLKLKILCGVYTLQSTRASFNQNILYIDPTCQVCCSAPETLVHFILKCAVLLTIRNPIIYIYVYQLSAWPWLASSHSMAFPTNITSWTAYMPYLTLWDKISQNLAHLEAISHKFIKSHRIFRPSYNTFNEEININHILSFLSQASCI